MKFKIGKKHYKWNMKVWQAYLLFAAAMVGIIACIELPAMVGIALEI